jgi:mannose-1-phosphate guanylyltransferase
MGCTDIVFTLGYLGGEMETLFGDGSAYGVRVTYVYETEKRGTAGSVKNAEKYLSNEPFLVLGGDHLTNIDLFSLYNQHCTAHPSAFVTLGLITVEDPSEYGIADLEADKEITRFLEKPKPGEAFSNLVSTGIYVCSPEIFSYIPDNTMFDFAKDLFPLLMEKQYRINGWLARGIWSDVGSPKSLREATTWVLQSQIDKNQIPSTSQIQGSIEGPVKIGERVQIGKGSCIVGPVVIDAGTVIEENVLIGPHSSIGKNCQIKSGSRIFSSSLYDKVTIGENSVVCGAIVDELVEIGSQCTVEHGSVIGFGAVVGDGCTVYSHVRIWPEYMVSTKTRVDRICFSDGYDHSFSGS